MQLDITTYMFFLLLLMDSNIQCKYTCIAAIQTLQVNAVTSNLLERTMVPYGLFSLVFSLWPKVRTN